MPAARAQVAWGSSDPRRRRCVAARTREPSAGHRRGVRVRRHLFAANHRRGIEPLLRLFHSGRIQLERHIHANALGTYHRLEKRHNPRVQLPLETLLPFELPGRTLFTVLDRRPGQWPTIAVEDDDRRSPSTLAATRLLIPVIVDGASVRWPRNFRTTEALAGRDSPKSASLPSQCARARWRLRRAWQWCVQSRPRGHGDSSPAREIRSRRTPSGRRARTRRVRRGKPL